MSLSTPCRCAVVPMRRGDATTLHQYDMFVKRYDIITSYFGTASRTGASSQPRADEPPGTMAGVTEPASSIAVNPKSAVGTGSAPPPTIMVKSNFWNNWARIAIAHAKEARQCRDQWKSGTVRN